MTKDEYYEWIQKELDKRGWSLRELERRASISLSSVQRAVQGKPPDKPAGWEILYSVAKALKINPVVMFINAGLLPREPEQTTHERHLLSTFRQLPIEHQSALINFADYLFTQRSQLFPTGAELRDSRDSNQNN